jgi:hypothetical protein
MILGLVYLRVLRVWMFELCHIRYCAVQASALQVFILDKHSKQLVFDPVASGTVVHTLIDHDVESGLLALPYIFVTVIKPHNREAKVVVACLFHYLDDSIDIRLGL